ncbi:HepT-like ribonuclease domain-containing protein [Methylotetracoccus oryzae]|uniref:HepT-like ribonuclease domain-containing protein n=1 Tax=Methylotetracoccus oryzae TaxID=1919059 RepID=UPI0038B26091
MSPCDRSRFRQLLEAASDAVHFAAARHRSDLDQDKMLALALVKAIEIIGEAASRVSQEARAEHPVPEPAKNNS